MTVFYPKIRHFSKTILYDWNAEKCERKQLGPAIGDAIVKKCESIFSKMKGGRSGNKLEIKQGICYREGNMNLVDEILRESNTFLTENKQRNVEQNGENKEKSSPGKKSGQQSTGRNMNGRIVFDGAQQKLNSLCTEILGDDECEMARDEGRKSAKDFEKRGRSGGELEEKVKQMTVAKRILEKCGRISTQCSPGAKIFDNNNLEMPRVVWERGLDPVIIVVGIKFEKKTTKIKIIQKHLLKIQFFNFFTFTTTSY